MDSGHRMQALFALVSEAGVSDAERIRMGILASGLRADDPRLRSTMTALDLQGAQPIDLARFIEIVGEELLLVSKAIQGRLVIPEWQEFQHDIAALHQLVAGDHHGRNADYIPILRDADPERWGVSVCSVDGQRLDLGDVDCHHSIQSVSKPLSYAYALDRLGEASTAEHIGDEPSGRPFNSLDLLPDGRPFNACVNAGAILVAGLIAAAHPERSSRQVTQELMDLWSELCGHCGEVRLCERTMRSERESADRNFAMAYLMRATRGLPGDVDLQRMMDVYFSCCSIEMTASMLAVAAATLANGGVCPINGQQVLSTSIVKRTLSLMQCAGMYDNAGSFTLRVGLPAKSGVAGTVLVVVPNLLGLATFSPRLDDFGNSVRGVAFCHALVDRFNLHAFDCLSGGRSGCKRDPRASQVLQKQRDLSELRWAVSYGDRHAIRVRDLVLACMVDITLADGAIQAGELEAIADTQEAILGERPEPAWLAGVVAERQRLCRDGGSPFSTLLSELAGQVAVLDDNSRGLILEAAFHVACADGQVEPQERQRLEAIAQSLEIHPGVLDLEIARFQRRRG